MDMLRATNPAAAKLLLAFAGAALFPAHAETAKDGAYGGAVADGVTTAIGLAAGAAELNPLGPIVAIGMKAVVMRYANTLPDTRQPAAHAAAASIWKGAAANNVCVTAAVLTGGAFAPACIVVGAAWGLKTWRETEHERLFWEGCEMLRQYANQPTLECIYTPVPREQAGPADLAHTSAQLIAP